jgi:hypothetical protein
MKGGLFLCVLRNPIQNCLIPDMSEQHIFVKFDFILVKNALETQDIKREETKKSFFSVENLPVRRERRQSL